MSTSGQDAFRLLHIGPNGREHVTGVIGTIQDAKALRAKLTKEGHFVSRITHREPDVASMSGVEHASVPGRVDVEVDLSEADKLEAVMERYFPGIPYDEVKKRWAETEQAAERMCYQCKFFLVEAGWAGTRITPGYSPEVECLKRVFSTEDAFQSKGALGRCLKLARTCEHFEKDEDDE